MLNRRRLLQQSSLLTLSGFAPDFLLQTTAATEAAKDEPLLVVIELAGGNDGLNTVIPYRDQQYQKFRKHLQIEAKDVIKLNDSLGLHPEMKAAGELFDSGRLAIVPGVGYPNPNRSHFLSRDIWHSARLKTDQHNGQGWLGRSLDRSKNDLSDPDAVYVGSGEMPSAIVGRRTNSIAIGNEDDLKIPSGLSSASSATTEDDLQAFVQGTLQSSFDAARKFADATSDTTDGNDAYPGYRLAQQLKLVSRIIQMGMQTRVFYVSQPGYDTHSGQKNQHANLLRQYSRSLLAFLDDMKSIGKEDQVVVLTFSEFGRRVKENDSAGTDHGTSGPVFIAGKPVKAGLLAEYPALDDLVDGDLKTTVDFRRIYASLLTDWMKVDADVAIGGRFEPLRVVES